MIKEFNITHLTHSIGALVVQLPILYLTDNPWYGVVWAVGVYGSREVSQNEYKYIEEFCDNTRAKMPEYAGFLVNLWSVDSILDFICPVVATLGVAVLYGLL